jgi:hypothetical protein
MKMQMGADADGCRCRWVQMEMGADVDGCRWMQRQMGADADGCRCRWVQMQMGADADGCRGRWVQMQMGAEADGCRYRTYCVCCRSHRSKLYWIFPTEFNPTNFPPCLQMLQWRVKQRGLVDIQDIPFPVPEL